MLFGKKKKDQQQKPQTIKEALAAEAVEEDVEITEAEVSGEEDAVSGDQQEITEPESQQNDDAAAEDVPKSGFEPGPGPRDAKDVESTKGYIDFGAILVPAAKGQKIRLDIDQKTKRVVSLTISIGQASIQLQAFSAPKSGGIWEDVRGQIQESVTKQKGRTKMIEGRFGPELHARVPTVLKDGRQGWRAARFIGFEGSRWFLRGVIGGRGAIDRKASLGVEELFSRIIVNRGDDPLPPRELLKLNPPAGAKRVVVPKGQNPAEAGSQPNRTNGVPEAAKRDTDGS
ncbi:DUF3710 domain-containing protein [Nesterenkonia alkaliphila]|uniref:DUF3710 domain-containing protein n=1 Tax=Nesterenkonia alkaliphila TaxID=1463631 RepID=A0A7K1UMT9_9MICC|nr:DUF3710 domain-containing protein [Nesterenkonia alkaliphila]MVT27341.1 DUF3710 domain-containing protein [Nesterenkonia alkaliphila]GFZ80714.1 hypothetical protein GCM10011359_06480 [Nesterenkonia alkaliphila]